jgi:hypothetical protein
MHPYSASMTDRPRVIALAAMTAAAIFLCIGLAIDASGIRPPFWFTIPSAMAVFGVLFGLYDRALWRWSVGWVRLSRVPDLNGHWGGEVSIREGERRAEEGLEGIPCFVSIVQTWSKIRVDFETPFSRSYSSMASVSDQEFHYEYTVERKEGAQYPSGMKTHHGVARLHSRGDWQTLEGDFYNDECYPRSGPYSLARLAPSVRADEWLRAQQVLRARGEDAVARRWFAPSLRAWAWLVMRLRGPRIHKGR